MKSRLVVLAVFLMALPLVAAAQDICSKGPEPTETSLYPWLDCAPMRHPDDPRTADVLARLHAVAPRIPPGLGRTEDFFGRERWDLVSPFSRRILLTVRAATSSARRPYRPDLLALCLMCLYCRSRFGLAPRGMDFLPSRSRYHLHGSRNYL